jgi:hypothetical protein
VRALGSEQKRISSVQLQGNSPDVQGKLYNSWLKKTEIITTFESVVLYVVKADVSKD